MFQIDFGFEELQGFWTYANQAYNEPEMSALFNIGSNYDIIANNTDFTYISEYDDVLYIVVRGTDTGESLENKNYRQLIKKWSNNLSKLPLTKDGKWGTGMFHNGLYQVFMKQKSKLKDVMRKKNKNKKIFVIGHSRGGPVAVYIHRLLKKLEYKDLTSVTFGSPRHMSRAGVINCETLGLKTYNFINGYETISRLPKALSRNGFDIYLKSNSLNPFNFYKGLKNHTMEAYTRTINQLDCNKEMVMYSNFNKSKFNVKLRSSNE